MKFSYTLLKQYLPKLPNKTKVVDILSSHSFEAEDGGGNTIEVSLPPNRYSDSASHLGLARELSAILNIPVNESAIKDLPLVFSKPKLSKRPKAFSVSIKEKDTCARYSAWYFENVKIGSSPKWMQAVLAECGMRPINNVVDVMNFVMLETGQPLHAFDYDKLLDGKKAEIIVRKAKPKESITTIDKVEYALKPEMMLIANTKMPLAIAGIKGGEGCEVHEGTTRILVESANFDFVSVLKTSRSLGLATDASQRFSHNLSPVLVETGMSRAGQLLGALAHAHAGERYDSLAKPIARRIVACNVDAVNALLGTDLKAAEVSAYLKRLGFKNVKKDLWEVPSTRTDIENQTDMTEEVARMYGYQRIKAIPPTIGIVTPEVNEGVVLSELARNVLIGLGYDEVYHHSFISAEDIREDGSALSEVLSLANPTSAEFEYLRPMLGYGLRKSAELNIRHYDEVRMFEFGHVFSSEKGIQNETSHLGIAINKKGESFFELKGVVTRLLHAMNIKDLYMKELQEGKNPFFLHGGLEIRTGDEVLGYMGLTRGNVSLAELDMGRILDSAESAREYEPIQKYPAVIRDISLMLPSDTRVGEVIEAIQNVNRKDIFDVDLVDEYVDAKWADVQSVTLRIVFQAKDRTLTSEEVDGDIRNIMEVLSKKFGATAR